MTLPKKIRWLFIFVFGVAMLLVGYFVLPALLERRGMPTDLPLGLAGSDSFFRPGGFAPVVVRGWTPKRIQDVAWVTRSWWGRNREPIKLVELEVVHGQVFVNDKLLPRDGITPYLNAQKHEESNAWVIVFPAKGSTMGEVIPVLDECKKSKIDVVVLNYHETQ